MSSEASFASQFVKYCRSRHYFVQRIESGTTGAGIPDLFLASSYTEKQYWIELKRVHKVFDVRTAIERGYSIPVKQTQLDWLHSLWCSKGNPYLLVKFDNCIVSIPIRGQKYGKHFSYDEIEHVYTHMRDILL